MNKTFKFRMIATLGIVMCLSLAFGLFSATPATAKAATPDTFEMLGASIRYESAIDANDNGIRFGVQLDKTAYAALTADENAEAGILICPADQYAGELALTAEKATKAVIKGEDDNSANVMIGAWTENAAGYMQAWAYLKGIPAASFNRPVSGRAYIDWDGDGSDVDYSDSVTKAIADVALAVRTDYEATNEYATTDEQYASLDDYLLNYNVRFLDAYGNAATQSVKYGSEFEVPADPAERTGYTFDGWYEQLSDTLYADTAADFATADKTVKYAMTYKSAFTAVGPTYEKPAMESKIYNSTVDYYVTSEATRIFADEQGAYFFTGAEVAQDEEFVIWANVKGSDEAPFGNNIGFVVGTLAETKNHLMFHIRANDVALWRNAGGWNGHADNVFTPGYGTRNVDCEIALVYRSGYYYFFFNGERKAKINENGFDNGWGGTFVPKNVIGTTGTKKIGLSVQAGRINCSDWGYSTDVDVLEQYVSFGTPVTFGENKMTKGTVDRNKLSAPTGDSAAATAALFDGVSFTQGTNFVLSVDVIDVTAENVGFIAGTFSDGTGEGVQDRFNVHFQWRKNSNDIYVVRYAADGYGWSGEGSVSTAGLGLTYGDATLTFVYTNETYYMFINGVKVMENKGSVSPSWGGSWSYLGCLLGNISAPDPTKAPIKFGGSVFAGSAKFVNLTYSTDAEDIEVYVPSIPAIDFGTNVYDKAGGSISGNTITSTSDNAAAALVNGAQVERGSAFVVSVKASGITATNVGFIIGKMNGDSTPPTRYHLLVLWRNDKSLYVFRAPNGSDWGWDGEGWKNCSSLASYTTAEMTLTFAYYNGYYYMYVNGTKILETTGQLEASWGGNGTNLAATGYWNEPMKVGLSVYNGSATFSDFVCSTDADVVATYIS